MSTLHHILLGTAVLLSLAGPVAADDGLTCSLSVKYAGQKVIPYTGRFNLFLEAPASAKGGKPRRWDFLGLPPVNKQVDKVTCVVPDALLVDKLRVVVAYIRLNGKTQMAEGILDAKTAHPRSSLDILIDDTDQSLTLTSVNPSGTK